MITIIILSILGALVGTISIILIPHTKKWGISFLAGSLLIGATLVTGMVYIVTKI